MNEYKKGFLSRSLKLLLNPNERLVYKLNKMKTYVTFITQIKISRRKDV